MRLSLFRGTIGKSIALTLALTFGLELLWPTESHALTGGPSQPEVESFEPIGTTQMVDLYSGDFNYNIPLMTVPGPNGGYPINLAYHAGIGMEQQASWVGLGWNINPGAITRAMRGLPDDFSGDDVTHETYIKPNRTMGIGIPGMPGLSSSSTYEIFGFEFTPSISSNATIYYNNYRGVGFRGGVSLSMTRTKELHNTSSDEKETRSIAGSLSQTFDSQTGMGFSPSISATSKAGSKSSTFNGGLNFHSRQGLVAVSLSRDMKRYGNKATPDQATFVGRKGAGISFANSTYVPKVNYPMTSYSFNYSLTLGKEDPIGNFVPKVTVPVEYVENSLTELGIKRTFDAYGYLNTQDAVSSNEERNMFDFNREKDGAVTKRTPSMYLPISTHDVYMIQGQGTGGVFRPFRGDIGRYYDPKTTSNGFTVNLGIAGGAGTGWKLGGDLGIGYSNSYSGKWKNQIHELNDLESSDYSHDDPLSEPYYFKSNGELTAKPLSYFNNIGRMTPISMDLKTVMGLYPKPRVEDTYFGGGQSNLSANTDRVIKNQLIGYRTKEEVRDAYNYNIDQVANIYPEDTFPWQATSGTVALNEITSGEDHHIHEVSVVNSDGSRYVYGLPAYNHLHDDYMFALGTQDIPIDDYDNPPTIEYDEADVDSRNGNGRDEFYNKTSLPPYAHSYMLTAVYSHDYVDLKGDGPTQDDLGYYTKFNYSDPYASGDYEWRIPYGNKKANYSKGFYSNQLDDKASFSYGKKDIYYVHSIETKTHIAMFSIGDRADGEGVSGVHDTGSTEKSLKYLKTITLYSKEDLANPIKKVHFQYDYSLCQGVPNNDVTVDIDDADHILGDQGGKLTLQKVYFSYLGNEKGRLSPFEFDYSETNTVRNPDYSERKMDRWGNYQPEGLYTDFSSDVANNVNPYTYQGTNVNRHDQASAWCMRKVSLPSGGDINIKYEADDYGYVQDKRALQMCEILGFQNEGFTPYTSQTQFDNAITGANDRLRKNNRRVYFRMQSVGDDASKYIEGLDGKKEIYFKTWQRLKRKPELATLGDYAYDYVEGYCEIESGSAGEVDNTDIGYFTVKGDHYGVGDAFDVHPFRKAGWQYIRVSRPDLFPPGDNEPNFDVVGTAITSVISILTESIGLAIGYYKRAAALGYCSRVHLEISDADPNDGIKQPSFVRLNTPDYKKYGGGCRVSEINMTDNWDVVEGNSATYGQTYEYTSQDGTQSSGVADYEPLIGGEENPFRKPVWYNGNQAAISIRHDDAYIEKPYGESYFPSANVGYSRVVVKSLNDGGNVEIANDGVVVNEFYTSKDFPTIVDVGEFQHKGFNLPLIIPFIGGINIASNGYSQGYTIELNDMSGKPKMVTTYKYGSDFTELPVSQTEYTYHTNPNSSKRLKNVVPVLVADGQMEQKYLGINHDFVMDERQHSTTSVHIGGNANLDGSGAVFAATLLPGSEISHSLFRSVGSTKVIYRTGILKEVRNYTDGATIKTNNLLYDEVTGAPLLTSVTNEFKEPVYTYSFPAHWNYEGMNGAWKNQGAVFKLGTYDLTNGYPITSTALAENALFFVGDQVQLYDFVNGEYETYFVWSVNSQGVFLEDENGSNITGAKDYTGVIKRSGRRNHLSTNSGTIVALRNPILNGMSIPEYFKLFNNHAGSSPFSNVDFRMQNVEDDCGTDYSSVGTARGLSWVYETNMHYTISSTGTGIGPNCSSTFTINDADGFDLNAQYEFDLLSFVETLSSPHTEGTINLINIDPTSTEFGEVYPCYWTDEQNCFDACPTPIAVLHADATEFTEDWTYNYADVGSPQVDPTNSTVDEDLSHTSGVNEHRYGQKGVWRAMRSNVYLIDRLQTNTGNHKTEIDLDGEYNTFVKFDWSNPTTSHNGDWEWTTEITKYSPYGFELENKDRLGVYSAEMYGYNQSVVTTVGSNSKYHEIAFDGFEDYSSSSLASADHGHFQWKLVSTNNIPLSTNQAHSGAKSVLLQTGETMKHLRNTANQNNYLIPETTKPYVVTAWIYTGEGGDATLQITTGAGPTVYSKATTANDVVTIDGWTRVSVDVDAFETGTPSPSVDIQVINASGSDVYVDDIRVQPKVGAMKTFVYDPKTLWLVAEQDNFGFTTYYNYDEEGTLVQVKQETERGIITLSTSRQNTKQTP